MNNYRRNSKPHSRLLPYATIRAASEGDPDAVNAVLRPGRRIPAAVS